MPKNTFSEKFDAILKNKGVSEKARPYYHRNLAQWGKHLRREKQRDGVRAGEGDSFDYLACFKGWLEELGRNPRCEDYQIRQSADAVRIAHGQVLEEGWATAVDWVQRVDAVIFTREGGYDPAIDGPENVQKIIEAARAKGLGEEDAALMGRLVTRMRERHYAYRTEQTYREWIQRFLLWGVSRGVEKSGGLEVGVCASGGSGGRSAAGSRSYEAEAFLGDLAVRCGVAKATQKQAVNALSYFFRQVLGVENPDFSRFAPARLPRRVPVVLSRGEIGALLGVSEGVTGLMMKLMYGTGMRLME